MKTHVTIKEYAGTVGMTTNAVYKSKGLKSFITAVNGQQYIDLEKMRNSGIAKYIAISDLFNTVTNDLGTVPTNEELKTNDLQTNKERKGNDTNDLQEPLPTNEERIANENSTVTNENSTPGNNAKTVYSVAKGDTESVAEFVSFLKDQLKQKDDMINRLMTENNQLVQTISDMSKLVDQAQQLQGHTQKMLESSDKRRSIFDGFKSWWNSTADMNTEG